MQTSWSFGSVHDRRKSFLVGSLGYWLLFIVTFFLLFFLSGKYLLYEYLSTRANIVDTFFRPTSALSFPTADIPLSCIVVNSVGRSVVRALSVSLEGTAPKEDRGEAIKVTSLLPSAGGG